jgi:hypothetical protein
MQRITIAALSHFLASLALATFQPASTAQDKEPKTLPTLEALNKEWKGKSKADVKKHFGEPTDAISRPTDPPTSMWTYKGKELSKNADTDRPNLRHYFHFKDNTLHKINGYTK